MKTFGLPRAGIFFACLAVAAAWSHPVARAADAGNTKEGLRVAVMDFTADDGSIGSAEGAGQWSLLTQAGLAGEEPGIQWIERAQLQLATRELNLSAGGFTSVSDSLRAGRWVKADLAILGRFTRNEHEEDGHTLHLEIVDLDRADTLAVRTILVPGDRRETIAPDAALVRATAAALHEALGEARAKLAQGAGRRVLAPLFICNADPSPRLDSFGSDLINALTRAADRSDDVRALRFPQADRTRGEAELAVAGFTEANGRTRVADLYVWGSYRELPDGGTVFAQTPVEIDLTLWDGVRPPAHLIDHTTVAELPARVRRLAGQCLEAVRKVPADRAPLPSSDATGRLVGEMLRAQGERLTAVIDGYHAQRGAFLQTPEGKKTDAQARLLLETACFFAPNDSAAQVARLHAQWGGFPMPADQLPLLEVWRYANEVAAEAERSTAAGGDDLRRARLDLDAYLLDRLDEGDRDMHEAHSAHLKRILPVDVPDATLAAWHAELEERFARDAEALVKSSPAADLGAREYGVWLRAAFILVHDPLQGTRIVEALWPRYTPLYRRDPKAAETSYWRCENLTAELRKLYLRRKQSDLGETLLAALTTSEARSPDTVVVSTPAAAPAKLLVLTPVIRTPRYTSTAPDPLPGGTPVVTQVIHMPRDRFSPPGPEITEVPRYTVHSLTLNGAGTVWMSVLREKGIGEKLAPLEESQELVCFDPGDETFRHLSIPGLTARPPVAAVFPTGDEIWLAQDFAGLLRYDPAAAKVTRRYTVADGLATANVDRGVVADDGRTYLVGHEHGLALVQAYDPARQEWLRVGLVPEASGPAAAESALDAYLAPVAQLATCGHWILTGLGPKWTLLDRTNGQTRDVSPLLDRVPPAVMPAVGAPLRGNFDSARWLSRAPQSCGADAGGFWLAVRGTIIRFDPAQPEAARYFPLPAELPLGVTALASDGEDLWVVGPSGKTHPPMEQPAPLAMQLPPMRGLPYFGIGYDGRGFVARLHVADGQWRGGFEVTERVGCLAVSKQTLYLGLTTAAQPLVAVDKGSLQIVRQDR